LLLRLLPGDDGDQDIDILSSRHQLAVVQRHPPASRVRFESIGRAVGRAWLAAPLQPLPHPTLLACGCWCGPPRSSSGTVT
jgi:hypothetical protein